MEKTNSIVKDSELEPEIDGDVSPAIDTRTQAERYQHLMKKMDEWMNDTSGEQERDWLEFKKILEDNRMSERRIFAD